MATSRAAAPSPEFRTPRAAGMIPEPKFVARDHAHQEPSKDMSGDIEARTKEIICEQLDVKPEDVSEAKSFTEDFGADSLEHRRIVK